jgi:hypothetical protein
MTPPRVDPVEVALKTLHALRDRDEHQTMFIECCEWRQLCRIVLAAAEVKRLNELWESLLKDGNDVDGMLTYADLHVALKALAAALEGKP